MSTPTLSQVDEPQASPLDEFELRFWSKVAKSDSCWLWTAARNGRGYGVVRWGSRTQLAHRIAYYLVNGDFVPELDHLCRMPGCVNPDHLEPVDHQTNMRRGIKGMKTHCPRNHPYDEENTYITKAGHRQCRTCRDARNKARFQ